MEALPFQYWSNSVSLQQPHLKNIAEILFSFRRNIECIIDVTLFSTCITFSGDHQGEDHCNTPTWYSAPRVSISCQLSGRGKMAMPFPTCLSCPCNCSYLVSLAYLSLQVFLFVFFVIAITLTCLIWITCHYNWCL